MPFRDAILGLHLVSNQSQMRQELEFKRFIDEFGTHYASHTLLGVKLYSEFRFSKNETLHTSENSLKAEYVRYVSSLADAEKIRAYCDITVPLFRTQ